MGNKGIASLKGLNNYLSIYPLIQSPSLADEESLLKLIRCLILKLIIDSPFSLSPFPSP